MKFVSLTKKKEKKKMYIHKKQSISGVQTLIFSPALHATVDSTKVKTVRKKKLLKGGKNQFHRYSTPLETRAF